MNIHIAIMTIRVEIYTVIYKTAFFLAFNTLWEYSSLFEFYQFENLLREKDQCFCEYFCITFLEGS